jgi:predicted transport protein
MLGVDKVPLSWRPNAGTLPYSFQVSSAASMSDIKLFRFEADRVAELAGHAVQMEKSLQQLFEANLEALLGARFLASEHSTGPVHGGRIDTLGLDEDGCPVIVEYKRAINENVINQGLYYLDWLMDHRKEFQWLVLEQLGADAANTVDWSTPRLLCIAGDFTRYDEHAVKQINRNIELLRYRRFGTDLLMIELVHAPKLARVGSSVFPTVGSAATTPTLSNSLLPIEETSTGATVPDPYATQRIAFRIANAPPAVRDIYEAVSAFLSGLGDDVQVKELKNYVAFKRIKNFACVELFPQAKVVLAFLKVDPDSVALEPGFLRDVRKVGHFGTGDLEVSMRSLDDFAKAQALFQRAYEGG